MSSWGFLAALFDTRHSADAEEHDRRPVRQQQGFKGEVQLVQLLGSHLETLPNGITLGQTLTDPINRMITITEYTSYTMYDIESNLELVHSGSN
jgi:hypothetical protein